jgi:hypothetical protein
MCDIYKIFRGDSKGIFNVHYTSTTKPVSNILIPQETSSARSLSGKRVEMGCVKRLKNLTFRDKITNYIGERNFSTLLLEGLIKYSKEKKLLHMISTMNENL